MTTPTAQGPVDVNVRPDVPSAYRTFADMCWAVPGQRMDDLEYRMRYAAKDAVFTMSERLTLASFLSAYREIVRLPQKERNERIKEIRQGPNAKNQGDSGGFIAGGSPGLPG